MASDIVFWQCMPSHHQAGALEHFATLWPGNIYGIYDTEMLPERRAGGWVPVEMQGVSQLFLDQQKDPAGFVEQFLKEHPDAIHILGGLRGTQGVQLAKKYLFAKGVSSKVGFIAERPSDYGKLSRKLSLFALYRAFFWRYGKRLQLGLVMGTTGVDSYTKLGCPREILFPFMYQYSHQEEVRLPSPEVSEEDVKFLYIGNFSRHKGTDLLVNAAKHLPKSGWQLSLIGGGGALEPQILAWAERMPQVSYLGRWPSDKIVEGIATHDVCLIPSRYDGWGMVTNEALQGGIGAIVSKAAGSCDLIEASGAGRIVAGGSEHELAMAMKLAIVDKQIVPQWKERARRYLPRIQKEVVGQYLFDVIRHRFGDLDSARPTAPWL